MRTRPEVSALTAAATPCSSLLTPCTVREFLLRQRHRGHKTGQKCPPVVKNCQKHAIRRTAGLSHDEGPLRPPEKWAARSIMGLKRLISRGNQRHDPLEILGRIDVGPWPLRGIRHADLEPVLEGPELLESLGLLECRRAESSHPQ
jgi:hypothetical protein